MLLNQFTHLLFLIARILRVPNSNPNLTCARLVGGNHISQICNIIIVEPLFLRSPLFPHHLFFSVVVVVASVGTMGVMVIELKCSGEEEERKQMEHSIGNKFIR